MRVIVSNACFACSLPVCRYWLPDILKHKNIALRFLNQDSYSSAAPLDITPIPDVVTRVFMLFRGITSEEFAAWDQALNRTADDWKSVVDAPVKGMCDETLFRVLEWGGMEVVSVV